MAADRYVAAFLVFSLQCGSSCCIVQLISAPQTVGQTAEAVSDPDRAIAAYESALRHNAYSVVALSQIAAIYRSREEFKMAAEYFGRVVSIAPESGDVWGALGEFRRFTVVEVL